MIIFGAQRHFMRHAYSSVRFIAPTTLVETPADLERAMGGNPEWVFLPDWSHFVRPELLAKSKFVGFHCADLPNYRGGSPIQHQILDGKTETKLTAFRMTEELDGGNILLQRDLDLSGTATDIWNRIAAEVPSMIYQIFEGNYQETPQPTAKPGVWRRRKPEESQLRSLAGMPISKLYDFIRMLDHPYPNAFLVIDGKRMTFSAPDFSDNKITAKVEITNE